MNNKDNIWTTIGLIFIGFLMLSPWFMWYQEAKERNQLLKDYKNLKAEIKNINKLVDSIDKLTETNERLAKSENKYINLYCASIKFSSKECKNFIVETQKAIIKEKQIEEESFKELLKPVKK
jgi:hypothetical protein